ncbi:MAG: hypothetical protein ABR567_01975 [Myxococcales bacterium]|nr:hypothetical protein [Myxococcales bacterium]
MSKFIKLCTALALAAACAHESPPPVANQRNWEQGLDSEHAPQIAPLGPLENDQFAYDFIRRREREHALGTKATAADLDEIVNNSSQVLASALALPLFRAGVYLGSPRLIEKACTAGQRVTNSALRASGNVEAALQGCSALTTGTKPTNDGCGEGQAKLREAYSLLAAEKAQDAGHAAADAVRMLRDRCSKMGAPLRSPVDPSTRGFLIVWVLHANDAPPVTFLAGETAPSTAEAINDAFLRGVQAVRPMSSALPRGEVHAERSP